MWDASLMPWAPELFTAPALQSLEDKRHRKFETVPFFDGILTGEVEALIGSFAGEPVLYHPVRGRIRGRREFEAYVSDTQAWLTEHNCAIDEVLTIHGKSHGTGEAIVHLDGGETSVDLPVAVAADRARDGRLVELRVYYSTWPLTARHANRQPVLQPDPKLRAPDVVADYQRALSAGDLDAIVAAFEPDGYAREPAGGRFVHSGPGALRAFYEQMFSNGGGIELQHCGLIDDGRACALEYNAVRWGKTELPPQAGMAVYVRGATGKLAAARIYDDVNPPIGSRK
ncbi:MAG: nuclear transport factor 2 family protein [Solirubrobacteraceae bacterium]